MKKAITALLVITVVLLCCSCGQPASAPAAEAPAAPVSAAPEAPAPAEEPAPAAEAPAEPAEEPAAAESAPAAVPSAFTPVRQRLGSGGSAVAALLSDGTVACSLDTSENQYIRVSGEWLDWTDIVDISMNEEILAAVRADGTVVWCGGRVEEYDWLTDPETMGVIDTWQNMVQVSAGPFDIAALRADGSIEVTGSVWTEDLEETDGFKQVEVYDALAALRADGTVYCYAPYVYEGQTWEYDTGAWTDVVQISAGYDHIAALRADGTVVATGNNEVGACDTQGWTDIVQVAAGRCHTIGLKSDGTLVYCGEPFDGFDLDFLSGWTGIVEVSGFFDTVMGLKSDGSIVYTGLPARYNPLKVSNIG